MEKYIKYKRIRASILDSQENIQTFLDELIKDGWEIIYWNEKSGGAFDTENSTIQYHIDITTLVGKRQNNVI